MSIFVPHNGHKYVWILIPGFRGICSELLPSNQKEIFTAQSYRDGVYEENNLRIILEGGGASR
jgi:hypothetical protein